MSAKRKRSAVLRLLKGEDLELLSRELGVPAADLTRWRDAFLEAGEASLKSRPTDDRDAEIARLERKVGDLTMSKELLEAKIDKLPTPRSRLRGGPGWRVGALWPGGGRGHERRRLALHRSGLRRRPCGRALGRGPRHRLPSAR
jgi:hypothetical protein